MKKLIGSPGFIIAVCFAVLSIIIGSVILLAVRDDADTTQRTAAAYVTRLTGYPSTAVSCTYVNNRGYLCDVRSGDRVVSVFCSTMQWTQTCAMNHGVTTGGAE